MACGTFPLYNKNITGITIKVSDDTATDTVAVMSRF